MSETLDVYKYRCNLRRNGKKMWKKSSIFCGSIFSNTHLKIFTVLKILYEWIKNVSHIGELETG
jgi:hypothetical protein